MSVSAVNLREAFHAGRKVRLHGIHLPAATRTTGGKPVAEEMMAEQNFGAVPEANPGGYNFGTFGGVYTPALLTILGLVMFMRINFVLGEAGLFRTILILAIGASINGLLVNKDCYVALGPLANNGKSVTFNTILKAFGNYGDTIAVSVLLEKDESPWKQLAWK